MSPRRGQDEPGLAARGLDPWALSQAGEAVGLAGAVVAALTLPQLAGGDREDFAQVGRLAALQALMNYDPGHGASWRTWVVLKVRFAVQDELRRLQHAGSLRAAGVERVVSLSCLTDGDEDGNDDWEPASPWDWDRWLTERVVAAAVGRLAPKLRAVVLARLRGQSFRQIAARAKVHVKTVEEWHRLARQVLRRDLGEWIP